MDRKQVFKYLYKTAYRKTTYVQVKPLPHGNTVEQSTHYNKYEFDK